MVLRAQALDHGAHVVTALTPVESSNIEAVGYDDATRSLTVKFKNGTTFRYDDVEPEHYENMISADSVGSYFHKNVRNDHEATRIG